MDVVEDVLLKFREDATRRMPSRSKTYQWSIHLSLAGCLRGLSPFNNAPCFATSPQTFLFKFLHGQTVSFHLDLLELLDILIEGFVKSGCAELDKGLGHVPDPEIFEDVLIIVDDTLTEVSLEDIVGCVLGVLGTRSRQVIAHARCKAGISGMHDSAKGELCGGRQNRVRLCQVQRPQ